MTVFLKRFTYKIKYTCLQNDWYRIVRGLNFSEKVYFLAKVGSLKKVWREVWREISGRLVYILSRIVLIEILGILLRFCKMLWRVTVPIPEGYYSPKYLILYINGIIFLQLFCRKLFIVDIPVHSC